MSMLTLTLHAPCPSLSYSPWQRCYTFAIARLLRHDESELFTEGNPKRAPDGQCDVSPNIYRQHGLKQGSNEGIRVWRGGAAAGRSRLGRLLKLCGAALTFHVDLPVWSVWRWEKRRERAAGWGRGRRVWRKPEDPGYLLLLAAPRTKRRLHTSFFFFLLPSPCSVWLQTMGGFESARKQPWQRIPSANHHVDLLNGRQRQAGEATLEALISLLSQNYLKESKERKTHNQDSSNSSFPKKRKQKKWKKENKKSEQKKHQKRKRKIKIIIIIMV